MNCKPTFAPPCIYIYMKETEKQLQVWKKCGNITTAKSKRFYECSSFLKPLYKFEIFQNKKGKILRTQHHHSYYSLKHHKKLSFSVC